MVTRAETTIVIKFFNGLVKARQRWVERVNLGKGLCDENLGGLAIYQINIWDRKALSRLVIFRRYVNAHMANIGQGSVRGLKRETVCAVIMQVGFISIARPDTGNCH